MGELVIFPVIPAAEHGEAPIHGELPGGIAHGLFLPPALVRGAEIAGLDQLFPNFPELRGLACGGEGVEDIFHIGQLLLSQVDLVKEGLLGPLEPGVFPEKTLGVFLGREEGVQRHRHLGESGVKIVGEGDRLVPRADGIEIGGDEIGGALELLPLLGGKELLPLAGQLAAQPVPEGGHGADGGGGEGLQVAFPGLLPVKAVQQLGKARLLPAGDRRVLGDGEGGKIPGFPVLFQQKGAGSRLPQGQEKPGRPLRRFPLKEGLPGQQGRQPRHAPAQAGRVVPAGAAEGFHLRGRQLPERGLVLPGGQPVAHPRLDGPGRALRAHLVEGGQDDPLLTHQDQVGHAAHHLADEALFGHHPQLVGRGDAHLQQTLVVGLGDRDHPPAPQELAQQHTEHGGRLGIFIFFPGEVDSRPRAGGQKQPAVPHLGGAEGEDHPVPGGHGDPVHPGVPEVPVQLPGQAGDDKAVKRHENIPPIGQGWLLRCRWGDRRPVFPPVPGKNGAFPAAKRRGRPGRTAEDG